MLGAYGLYRYPILPLVDKDRVQSQCCGYPFTSIPLASPISLTWNVELDVEIIEFGDHHGVKRLSHLGDVSLPLSFYERP